VLQSNWKASPISKVSGTNPMPLGTLRVFEHRVHVGFVDAILLRGMCRIKMGLLAPYEGHAGHAAGPDRTPRMEAALCGHRAAGAQHLQTVVGTIVRINDRTATIDPGDGTK
ncbi:hypothetical protein ACFIQG_21590, partial [Comamonas odontotermitis]